MGIRGRYSPPELTTAESAELRDWLDSVTLGADGSMILPTITVTGLTPSRALYADVGCTIRSAATTAVELSYVNGVTSAIQTQLDNIVDGTTGLTVIDETFNIVDDGDATKKAEFECCNIASGNTRVITVPNWNLDLRQPNFVRLDVDNVRIDGDAIYNTTAADLAITSGWTAAGQVCADLGCVTTADINGGTIDGTTIGATIDAAGKFTTIIAIGNISQNYGGGPNTHLALHGRTAAGANCGGSIRWYENNTVISGYTYVSDNSRFVWDTTTQAAEDDYGNAWVEFDTGNASFGALTATSIAATNANWDAAYNNMIASASWTAATGVITLTQQDAGTITIDTPLGTGDSPSFVSVTVTTSLLIPDGTEGAPSIAFADDLDTGIYSPADDRLKITAGGLSIARFWETDGDTAHVILYGDTDVQGDCKADTFTVDLTQEYKFLGRNNSLCLQGQTANTNASLEFYSKTGDAGDSVLLWIYAQGTPGDITAAERLQFGYNANDGAYNLQSLASGVETVHPIAISTQGNADQLLLSIDGSSSFSGALTVTGAMQINTTAIIANYNNDDIDFSVKADDGTTLLLCDAGGNTVTFGANLIFASILDVSVADGVGAAAITIDQDDQDQAFINYDGTEAADDSLNVSTGSPTGTTKKYVRVELAGVTYWMLAETWA